ncbi:MAG: hypothetical protein RL095_3109 [Verrucomicrobiota bacterium]|jgi:signal transduction histidine kinase
MPTKPALLLVDDVPENLMVLSGLLRPSYEIRAVTSGIQALQLLENFHPDLILLDIVMPDLDGIEILQRIRSRPSPPPVIMLTALDDVDSKVRAFEAGALDYITKPFQVQEVLARVGNQILIRSHARELESRNQELIRLNHQILDAQKTSDEFMRIASHDLRSPLSVILGNAELISLYLGNGRGLDPAKCLRMVGSMSAAASLMRCIIDDFIDFRILKDGQVSIHLESIDLRTIAEDVMQSRLFHAEKKSAILELDAPSPVPAWFDRSRILQVVDNLLSNALKYSPTGSQILIRVEETQGRSRLSVIDQGPGLRPEDFDRLFSDYARLSAQPTGGEKSLGLGLSICKTLMELHQGDIGAYNNPEGGATFWISLPNLHPGVEA